MKRRVSYVNRKYFRQLLAGLTAFLFLLYIPFSLLLLRLSENSIRNSISVSNQTVLDQLKTNYGHFADNIKSLSSSVFWSADIQHLLYARELPYEEVYRTLSDLMTTYLMSHPYLHSICLYNQYTGELFSVSTSGQVDKEQFLSYVASQDSLPVLRPMLHQMESYSYTTKLTPYVFSYFMYQFDDPACENESFLVLNQYASQAVSTIETSSGSSDSIPTATYYVTMDDHIASKPLDTEIRQDHELLLDSFRSKHQNLSKAGGSYEESVNGRKYLLTYTVADPDRSALLIIQDYDPVFNELRVLQRNFIVTSAVLFAAAIVLALRVSRRLYQPINTILNTFVPAEEPPDAAGSSFNELDFMRSRYETTTEQKKRLETRENRYQPIAQEYSLRSLLLKSDDRAIEKFRRTQPDHWLAKTDDSPLEILLFRPGTSSSGNMEMPLLLYAVQNISEELLASDFRFATFKYAPDTLGMVLQARSGDVQSLSAVLNRIREFMTEHFGVSLAVALSDRRPGLPALSSLLQQADLCLSYTFLFGPVLITPDMCVENEHSDQTAYDPELDSRLEDAIAKQDLSRCREVLDSIRESLRSFSTGNATICTAALLNQVNRFLSRHACLTANSAASASFHTLYGRISGGGTMEECFEDIFRYISSHLSDQVYKEKSSDQLFVETVIEFVQNSYNDISLSSQLIADYLGLSNRYLMKKFKSLTDETLTEFIVDFRIKKAASLLENTQEPISSIAEQVGIENLSYFYRLFKKVCGCTPKEYREMKQGTEAK